MYIYIYIYTLCFWEKKVRVRETQCSEGTPSISSCQNSIVL